MPKSAARDVVLPLLELRRLAREEIVLPPEVLLALLFSILMISVNRLALSVVLLLEVELVLPSAALSLELAPPPP